MDIELVTLEKLCLGSAARKKIVYFTGYPHRAKHAFIRRVQCEDHTKLEAMILFENNRRTTITNQRFVAELWATTSGGELTTVAFHGEYVKFENVTYRLLGR